MMNEINYYARLKSFRDKAKGGGCSLLPEDEIIEFARHCVENPPKPDTAAMQKEVDRWCRTDPQTQFASQNADAGSRYISELNERWRNISEQNESWIGTCGLPSDSEATTDAIEQWRRLAGQDKTGERDSAELGAAMAECCCKADCCDDANGVNPKAANASTNKPIAETNDTTPAHYACLPTGYRPADVARQWIEAAGNRITPWQAALLFQVMKYAGRFPFKGDQIGDIDKLIDYAKQLREEVILVEREKADTGS